MTQATSTRNEPIAEKLILDELFDLSLYIALRDITTGPVRKILEELIPIEKAHVAFWQNFFQARIERLDWARRVKLRLVLMACRLFGVTAIHLVLEAIEVYGVRKYLALWDTYKDGPLGEAVRGILEDEFKHEDQVVTELTERKINPERVRNIFLGLNDGLVEILGAVSGFFGAFNNTLIVLFAALMTAVAGALSMAAGAYVAASSEQEVARTEMGRRRFLGEDTAAPLPPSADTPLASARLVGVTYFIGALVPVLPVLFGAKTLLLPLITAGGAALAVSWVVAFLSGMDIKKRVMMNLVIIGAAVGITYALGALAKAIWGISI